MCYIIVLFHPHAHAARCTDRLQRLEETVEDQVPEDLPLLHRRNVPDQEVARHCKRRGQEDPGEVGMGGVTHT